MAKVGHTLDPRGEVCPFPLDQTKKAVENLEAGAIVEVLVAIANLGRWAEHAGHTVLGAKDLNRNEWSLVFECSRIFDEGAA